MEDQEIGIRILATLERIEKLLQQNQTILYPYIYPQPMQPYWPKQPAIPESPWVVTDSQTSKVSAANGSK
jgi:hypothetical protein